MLLSLHVLLYIIEIQTFMLFSKQFQLLRDPYDLLQQPLRASLSGNLLVYLQAAA